MPATYVGLNVLAFVLFLVAALLFAGAALGYDAPQEPARGRFWRVRPALVSAGLCVLTVAFIVQFGATSHTLTF